MKARPLALQRLSAASREPSATASNYGGGLGILRVHCASAGRAWRRSDTYSATLRELSGRRSRRRRFRWLGCRGQMTGFGGGTMSSSSATAANCASSNARKTNFLIVFWSLAAPAKARSSRTSARAVSSLGRSVDLGSPVVLFLDRHKGGIPPPQLWDSIPASDTAVSPQRPKSIHAEQFVDCALELLSGER